MIHSEPSAEGFYERLGSTKIGEGPFRFSPDVVPPQLLLNLP
jgi:hypothetical protein